MRKREREGKKKSQKEKIFDFYQFSHHSTICYLTSRRKTCFLWQPEPVEIPWIARVPARAVWQLLNKEKGEQATASTDAAEWSREKILLTCSPRPWRWQMTWFMLGAVSATHKKNPQTKAFLQRTDTVMNSPLLPVRTAKPLPICSITAPQAHVFPPITLVTSSSQSLQQLRGHSILPWQGQVTSVCCCCFLMSSVSPFQPLAHACHLQTSGNIQDFGSSGEQKPCPSHKNLSVYFDR